MIKKAYLIFAVLIVAPNCIAQSQKTGRLSDGRAYRIDESGMRLVDQVAELEVTNDDLKRQVVALEDEITDKNKTIESLRAGVKVPSDDKLKEQDLLGKTASGLPKAAVAPSSSCDASELAALKAKLQMADNQAQSKNTANANCDKQLSDAKQRYDSLAEENLKNKDKLALLNAEKNQLAAQLNSSKSPDSERNLLISKVAKLEQERSSLALEKENLTAENQKLKSNLSSLSSEKQNLARNLEQKSEEDSQQVQTEQELKKLQSELASVKEQLFDSQKEISKLKEQAPVLAATRTRMVETPAVQERPVLAASPEAKNLVSTIQSKIMRRKSLLDSVSKSGKGIAISASNLVTSNGLSLDRLRQAVNSGSADATVMKGLNEINNILDSDISTASRLAK